MNPRLDPLRAVHILCDMKRDMHLVPRSMPSKPSTVRMYGAVFPAWPDSVHVILPKNAVLRRDGAEPRYAHVLLSGLVTSTVTLSDGRSMAVCMHSEGEVLELEHLLGCNSGTSVSNVQVAGVAVRFPFAVLREALEVDVTLRKSLLSALGRRLQDLRQASVCNCLHRIDQRLCRHLLNVQNRTGQEELPLTQEQMAQHMGVRRTSLTVAAGLLRQRGYITLRRGFVTVRDREALEAIACECHRQNTAQAEWAS